MVYVTEINIYPIKSTRRIALTQSHVEKRGLAWDRRWMLVDDDGVFITARQHPTLTLVNTRVEGDSLLVNGPGMPELAIPLHPRQGAKETVRIWRNDCDALHLGAHYDQWFSDYLGLGCRLVHMPHSLVRPVRAQYGKPGDEVSFADGFPLLLISQASLEDLNSRLAVPVSMRRFRPNLVVTGCEPFAEDQWNRIRVGGVYFDVVKPCSRCVFTTIDPDTADKHPQKEPLRTLGTYRRRPEGGVFFGQNLIPRGTGTIRVGDEVAELGS